MKSNVSIEYRLTYEGLDRMTGVWTPYLPMIFDEEKLLLYWKKHYEESSFARNVETSYRSVTIGPWRSCDGETETYSEA